MNACKWSRMDILTIHITDVDSGAWFLRNINCKYQ